MLFELFDTFECLGFWSERSMAEGEKERDCVWPKGSHSFAMASYVPNVSINILIALSVC